MANHEIKRIGILTGGGDCPGINAVIRAVTKTAMFDHGWECFGIEDGFLGLIENRIRPLSREDVSNILTRGGTILGTSNKADPSRYAIGRNEQGEPLFADVRTTAMDHFNEHGLDALVVIGGDGTMSCAAEMIPMGLRCVGVPKTIDNDLMHTHVTFGFQTAVEIATEALDRLHTTAASHHRIMVCELMGRNAGWLTLHSGLASGSDVILIPEIPYDVGKICAFCNERMKHRKGIYQSSAVSEGARPADGEQFVRETIADSPDPVRLGGIAQRLQEQIESCSGHRNTCGRPRSHSARRHALRRRSCLVDSFRPRGNRPARGGKIQPTGRHPERRDHQRPDQRGPPTNSAWWNRTTNWFVSPDLWARVSETKRATLWFLSEPRPSGSGGVSTHRNRAVVIQSAACHDPDVLESFWEGGR